MSLRNSQLDLLDLIFSDNKENKSIHPIHHITIYHNNIISTLIRTLKDIYPLLYQLLGDDFFQITAKAYIKQYPSCSGNCHDYGEFFNVFLASYPPVHHLPYLSEVAQFEWICHSLCFSPNPIDFDLEKLKQLSEDQYNQLHFILNPASQLTHFFYPILQIIDLCERQIDHLDLNEDGVYLLIVRKHFKISLLTLSQSEFVFLSALQQQCALDEALSKTLALDKHFKLEDYFVGWVQNKIIVDCHFK